MLIVSWEHLFLIIDYGKGVLEGKNIIIFENDASLIKPFDIKELKSFDGDVLNLGKPNWGNRVWEGVGLYKRNINNLKTETDWEKENGILNQTKIGYSELMHI